MTDPAASVPATTDTALKPTDTVVDPGTKTTEPANDGLAALDEDTRKTVESKGWKGLGDAAKSYNELFTKFNETNEANSKALTPPAPDAPKEQWDAFYAKLGRPEKADGYEFKLPEDLPQDMPYDSDGAKMYREWSHEAGLTPKQAQIIHDRFAHYQAGNYQQQAQVFENRTTTATEALTKAWGGDLSSDSYKQNEQFANRFIERNGGNALLDELKANGTIAANGMILSPLTAQAFATAGRALYKEDKFVTGGPPAGAPKTAASIMYPTDPFKQG